ncbi:MAG: endonuclease/exonuclease/phosphatase family protein [Hasllibacter sp.]
MRGGAAALCGALLALPAPAETLRLAVLQSELSARGPGILLRDALAGSDAVAATVGAVARAAPDAILLAGLDWDAEGRAVAALQDRLAEAGHPMPHAAIPPPNAGVPTGRDLDGDGRRGEPEDAHGWGRFTGQGAWAILAVHPLSPREDRTADPWPGRGGRRLSSTSHASYDLAIPSGPLTLIAFHATPPAFRPENVARNAAELALAGAMIDAACPAFAVLAVANLDPFDGDGDGPVMRDFLARPDLTDPRPAAPPAHDDPAHGGDPALDTAVFERTGGLRVAYVLPAAILPVTGAALDRPGADAPSRHALVRVDLDLPARLPDCPPAP